MPWEKYRKLPVVIEATEIPHDIEVDTLEGVMVGHRGDMLIRGVNGELYPCKREIFDKTYEKVPDDI